MMEQALPRPGGVGRLALGRGFRSLLAETSYDAENGTEGELR